MNRKPKTVFHRKFTNVRSLLTVNVSDHLVHSERGTPIDEDILERYFGSELAEECVPTVVVENPRDAGYAVWHRIWDRQ